MPADEIRTSYQVALLIEAAKTPNAEFEDLIHRAYIASAPEGARVFATPAPVRNMFADAARGLETMLLIEKRRSVRFNWSFKVVLTLEGWVMAQRLLGDQRDYSKLPGGDV